MDRSKCREYTKDEIINRMFNNIDNTLETYAADGTQNDSKGRLNGDFVASQVMKELDGIHMDYSYLELIAVDERADIHGELYSLFSASNERLSSLLNQGIVTDMTVGFIKKVKKLTETYDRDPKMKHTELVAGIFDIVDNGIDGKYFRLDIGSSTEDKQELVGNGENYYPIKPLTISGDLGKRYREKHLKIEKAKKNPTLDPRYVVKNAAIKQKTPDSMVKKMSDFWNKVIGKTGGTKDER